MGSIGQRICELRTDRVPRLTQRELAERAGVSVDLIQKLEQGRKSTAKITTLTAIARALDVDLSALVSEPTYLAAVPEGGGLLALRRAITPVGDPVGEPGTAEDLTAALTDGWRAYWRGEYDALAAVLPDVVDSARALAVPDLLADAYHLAASVLVHLGHSDLALIAVGRALDVVEDSLLRAAVLAAHSWVLLRQGRPDDGAAIAVRAADAIEPSRKGSPQQTAVWGNLLISAATAAARGSQRAEAQDLLQTAHGAAVRIGVDHADHHNMFGVAKVVMHSVDVAVVGGDHARALEHARRMPKPCRLLPAARMRHLADVAHAHARLGHYRDAEDLLLRIDGSAPQWLRYQVFPRTVAAEILQHGRPTAKMRSLARRLGIH